MGKESKLIKDTIIYMIGNLGSKILTVLIVPLYTYYFSPHDLGNYDLITTTISLCIPIVMLQITDGVYRWLIVHPKRKDEIIRCGFNIVLKNMFIINVAAFILMHYIKIQYGILIILLLDSNIIITLMQQIARGLRNNKLFALSGIIVTVVTLTLNLILVCGVRMGVESLMIASICGNTISSIFIALIEPQSRLNLKIGFNKELNRKLIKFSLPLVPNTINWWIMNASDRYIIRFFLSSSANGIYAMTYKFPSLLLLLCSMFNQAWQDSAISQYSSEERNEFYSKIFDKYYSLLFTITMVLIPITKFTVILVMDRYYHDAWKYTSFLYLGTIFSSFSSFYGTGYLSSKATKGAGYTSVLGSVINIIINVTLIKFIGLYATSISTFLGFFIMWSARVIQTKRFFKITIKYKKFISLFALTLIYSVLILYSNIYIEIAMTIFGGIIFIINNYSYILDIKQKFINKKSQALQE